MLPVLIGLAGLGVDTGQIYLAHSRLQVATDAGALAGSLELPFDPDVNTGLVDAAARDMVHRNYEEAQVVSVSPGGEVRSVCVETRAEVDLILMDAIGISSDTVSARACAGFNNMEIVLAIDNSGSMKGTPIAQVNQAAENLVDLVLPEGSQAAIKVGLVPFRGKVRVPGGYDGLPQGCRNADGTLNEGLRDEYYGQEYRYPSYYSLRVSSDTCSNIPLIQPLSDNRDKLISSIRKQDAQGAGSGTLISEGIKWGRHVLSPEAPFTEGESEDRIRKIMIVLTDGDTEDGMCGGTYRARYTPNNYWTNAYYGMGDTESHCQDGGPLNDAMLSEAQLAKEEGVEIFAIRYGVSDNVDVNLMKAVASSKEGTDDHYFDAPSAYDIQDVFKQIGRQLGWRLLN